MGFQTQPSTSEHLDLSFPQPRVLLVRIAREKQLNALTPKLQQELSQVFDWFDEEVRLHNLSITAFEVAD